MHTNEANSSRHVQNIQTSNFVFVLFSRAPVVKDVIFFQICTLNPAASLLLVF